MVCKEVDNLQQFIGLTELSHENFIEPNLHTLSTTVAKCDRNLKSILPTEVERNHTSRELVTSKEQMEVEARVDHLEITM